MLDIRIINLGANVMPVLNFLGAKTKNVELPPLPMQTDYQISAHGEERQIDFCMHI